MSVSSVTSNRKTSYKIVLLGNSSVGKSSVIEKYVCDRFDGTSNPTICIDFMVKNNIMFKNKEYKLHIWDTAGQQRYQSLIPSYLKGAHCAIIMFDVQNKQSFKDIGKWLNIYREEKSELQCVILVGNKIDLPGRVVSREEGEIHAKELQVKYFEVSAKTGKKLNQLFQLAIDLIQTSLDPNNKDKQQIEEQKKEELRKKQQKNEQQTGGNFLKLKSKKKGKDCC